MFLHSFDCMAQGNDEQGSTLYEDADGTKWHFVLMFGGGDMEQLVQGWGLRSYNDAGQMCGMCLADRDGLSHTDLQEHAGWRATCPLTHDVLLKKC